MIAIYKILSPTGKVYIGQSIDIGRRFRQYKYSIKNCHQIKLKASIQKYGIKAHFFSIEYQFPNDVTTDVLNRYEKFYMDQHKEVGCEMMNIREAGSNGAISQETKNKISKSLKGVPKERRGYKISEEHRQAIIQANTGRKMPPRKPEWYEKQRAVMKGKASAMRGKKHTDISKIKMRDSAIGRKVSPESIIKREINRKANDIKFSRRNYI